MPTLPQVLHDQRLRTGWRALLALMLAVVSIAALSPGVEAASLGVGDKIDHLLAFVSLAFAASLSGAPTRSHVAFTASGLVAYGAFIEVAQTQVPGRHADMVDLAVDAAGTVLGLALAHGLRLRWPPSST